MGWEDPRGSLSPQDGISLWVSLSKQPEQRYPQKATHPNVLYSLLEIGSLKHVFSLWFSLKTIHKGVHHFEIYPRAQKQILTQLRTARCVYVCVCVMVCDRSSQTCVPQGGKARFFQA